LIVSLKADLRMQLFHMQPSATCNLPLMFTQCNLVIDLVAEGFKWFHEVDHIFDGIDPKNDQFLGLR
jgi:hypothetical protein